MKTHIARLPVAAVFAVSMISSGCATQPYSSPQQQAQNACQVFGPKTLSGAAIGALGGAAGGAGLGAAAGGGRGAIIGAGIGLLLGGITGLAVGHSLDTRDCVAAQQALAEMRHARVGARVAWSSPTGSHGSYTPISVEYVDSSGEVCRRVRQDAALQGRSPTSGVVVTCRTPDGDYRTVTQASS